MEYFYVECFNKSLKGLWSVTYAEYGVWIVKNNPEIIQS